MPERAAFILTACLAVLGWLVSHYVARAIASPTVEFSISEASDGNLPVFVYRLTNLSRTESFGPIEVHFLPKPASPIHSFDIKPVEPASEGVNPVVRDESQARYALPRLLPGSEVEFIVGVKGTERPQMYVDSATPVRLTSSSFETWLVRHEMLIVAICLLLALLALGWGWWRRT